MSSAISILRTVFASTKSKDIIRLINTFDRHHKVRRALDALGVLHVYLALNSVFLDNAYDLVKTLEEKYFQDNKKVKQLRMGLEALIKENGPGLWNTAKNTKKEDFMNFFSSSTGISEVDQNGKKLTKEQIEANRVNQEADEWLTLPDPEGDAKLSKEELKAKNDRLALRDKKLRNRVQAVAEFTKAFHEMFKDKEINLMLKKYNEDLFMDPKNWLSMSYINPDTDKEESFFDPDNFAGCNQEDAAQAYEHIIGMNYLHELAFEKENKDPTKTYEQFPPRFWKDLNNLELICRTLHEVKADDLNDLLNFTRRLFDDFMAEKIEDVRRLPQMIIDQIQRTTKFDSESAGIVGDFVIESVAHNIGIFGNAFKLIKNMIPTELWELGTEMGFDFREMDLDGMVQTGLSQIVDLRNQRINGEGANGLETIVGFIQGKARNLEQAAKDEEN